jgi:hypothetical protein
MGAVSSRSSKLKDVKFFNVNTAEEYSASVSLNHGNVTITTNTWEVKVNNDAVKEELYKMKQTDTEVLDLPGGLRIYKSYHGLVMHVVYLVRQAKGSIPSIKVAFASDAERKKVADYLEFDFLNWRQLKPVAGGGGGGGGGGAGGASGDSTPKHTGGGDASGTGGASGDSTPKSTPLKSLLTISGKMKFATPDGDTLGRRVLQLQTPQSTPQWVEFAQSNPSTLTFLRQTEFTTDESLDLKKKLLFEETDLETEATVAATPAPSAPTHKELTESEKRLAKVIAETQALYRERMANARRPETIWRNGLAMIIGPTVSLPTLGLFEIQLNPPAFKWELTSLSTGRQLLERTLQDLSSSESQIAIAFNFGSSEVLDSSVAVAFFMHHPEIQSFIVKFFDLNDPETENVDSAVKTSASPFKRGHIKLEEPSGRDEVEVLLNLSAVAEECPHFTRVFCPFKDNSTGFLCMPMEKVSLVLSTLYNDVCESEEFMRGIGEYMWLFALSLTTQIVFTTASFFEVTGRVCMDVHMGNWGLVSSEIQLRTYHIEPHTITVPSFGAIIKHFDNGYALIGPSQPSFNLGACSALGFLFQMQKLFKLSHAKESVVRAKEHIDSFLFGAGNLPTPRQVFSELFSVFNREIIAECDRLRTPLFKHSDLYGPIGPSFRLPRVHLVPAPATDSS